MNIKKGKVHFKRRDLWSLDRVLARVIEQGLIAFKKERKHGVNVSFGVDWCRKTNPGFQFDENITNEQLKIVEEAYYASVDDAIFAFQYVQDEHKHNKFWEEYSKTLELKYDDEEPVLDDENKNIGRRVTILYDERLSKLFEEEQKELEKRYEKGMEFFCKYFRTFYD